MASSAATRIDIVANDKASQVFERVGAEADKTASRLLGMGAATGRALKAAGVDMDAGLGKFAQQSSYLLSHFSTLRKQGGGAFADINSGLRDNIALLTQDTNAFITNTRAAIANKQARLDLVTTGIADNTRIIREIETDNQWKWKPEKRELRTELMRENVQLIGEQTTLTRALTEEQKKLDAVTGAGSARMAALKETFKSLKDAGANFINFLGGPWVIGITAAVAVVGLLSRAENRAEQEAKKYGIALDDVNRRYKDMVTGADQAATATLRASAAFGQAQREWFSGLQKQIDDAKKSFDLLADSATGTQYDFSGQRIKGVADEAQLKKLRDINAELQSGSGNVQELELRLGALRREVADGKASSEFIRLLDQMAIKLSFVAQNAEQARKALSFDSHVALFKGELGEIESAYKKTRQGQEDYLKKQNEIAQERMKRYKGTEYEGKTKAAAEEAARALQKFYDSGAAGGKSAASGVSQLQSALASVNDELARLTMTEEEYTRYTFDKKIAEYEKAGVAVEKLRELTEAWNAAQEKQQRQKNLQVLADFEKEYLEVVQGSEAAQIASIRERSKAYEEAGADAVRVAQWAAEQQLRYSRDAADGMKRSFRDYARDATNAAQNMERLVGNSMSSMEDALVGFVTTGKIEFSGLVNSILADLARLAIRQTITGPLASALGGLFGGGGNAGVSGGAGIVNSVFGVLGSAKGNVFPAGALSAYSNSIVTRPTVFAFSNLQPFARGGIMGEAGPEAVVPLMRDSRGRLGVSAEGGGAPVVNVTINTPQGMKAETEKRPNASGGFDLTIFIEQMDNAMAAGIASGRSKTAQAIGKMGRMS